MKQLAGIFVLFFTVLFLALPLQADIIYLDDGTIVKGKIVDQSEVKIYVRKKNGIQTEIPWRKVVKIERGGESALEIYKKKLSKIGSGDAEGHYKLGVWLKSINMDKEAIEEFTKAIIIDPDHQKAREKLGYILTPQGWKIPSEVKKEKEETEKVEQGPRPYRGNLPREAKKILKRIRSNHQGERKRGVEALRELRKKIKEEMYKEFSQGEKREKARVLGELGKVDPDLARELEKAESLSEELRAKLKKGLEKYLQETFDIQIQRYLEYRYKVLLARFKTFLRRLNALVSELKDGRAKKVRDKYLKRWEEARKEALRVIFDKSIYPDENHGRKGQPTVDEKVKAMREVWEFFNILIQRDLKKILSLKEKQAAKALKKLKVMREKLKHFGSVLRKQGSQVPTTPPQLSPRAKSLISYRAGKLPQGKSAAGRMNPWGQAMFKRLRAQRIMDHNKRISSQANPPLTALEAKQIKITNDYRIQMGRQPLEICPKLVKASRKHSQEMVKLGYFAHESPVAKNRTPSKRAQNEGHSGMVGENIYMSGGGMATPEGAFNGWYNSSGHHRNMLNDKWSCIGVGHHVTHWTQNFGGCKNCSR